MSSLCGPLCRGRPSLFTCHCITGVETGVSFDVFLFFLFSYFFALILHMALSRIESVLPQVFSPEWVTAPGMSKSLMGSRQTHIQEMTFTQKVTVRNRADTSHRGCHHIYLIFFILSHVLHLCSF